MPWPLYEKPPAAAFIDVDGTLLAHTTTYLFAGILHRRGLIRRSFMLRALYQESYDRLYPDDWWLVSVCAVPE